MPTTLNKEAVTKLFQEDLDWLLKQERTLERDHIEDILRALIIGMRLYYPESIEILRRK